MGLKAGAGRLRRRTHARPPLVAIFLQQLLFIAVNASSGGRIGVNYGRVANNLPPPAEVAQLVASLGIGRVKLYDADARVIAAFYGTGIELVVAVPNEQLPAMAASAAAARRWVASNVARHLPKVRIIAIAVGNEVLSPPIGSGRRAASLSPAAALIAALSHVHAALSELGLAPSIAVSTPLSLSTLSASFPPSAASFAPSIATAYVKPLLDFLATTGSPVMLNAYPFLAYASEPGAIPLSYALFREPAGGGAVAVKDPNTGLVYTNLFDAQLDAFYSAMAAVGHRNLHIVVTETGWPSAGDPAEVGAAPYNAQAYVSNLISRVASGVGTPLRPTEPVDVYIFALFNEDMKPGPKSERNYGLFYPDKRSVYELHLASGQGRRRGSPAAAGGGEGRNSAGPERRRSHHHHPHAAGGGGGGAGAGGLWCVANPGAGAGPLQAALDYACGPGAADCGAIQPGGACFSPDNLVAHASYAFDSYYQRSGGAVGACSFNGAAQITSHDPSYNGCKYPARRPN